MKAWWVAKLTNWCTLKKTESTSKQQLQKTWRTTKSKIGGRHNIHKCKYRALQTTGYTQEHESQIKHLKGRYQFWNKILWTDVIKINLHQIDGKRKAQRSKGTADDLKHHHHGGGSVMDAKRRRFKNLNKSLSSSNLLIRWHHLNLN